MSDIESLAKEYLGEVREPKPPLDIQPEKPRSGRSGKLLAVVLGVVLAFVLAEVGLRLSGYNAAETKKTTDVATGLRIFEAGAEIPFREECLTNTIITNSLGFHAAEHAIDPPTGGPSGVYRVVIVGDSFVEAPQMQVEQTFPALLEARLNERKDGRAYEVIALGISGNATYANLQYLKAYGLRFKPNLIIDAFYTNDVLADLYRPDNPSAAAPHDQDGNLVPVKPSASPTFFEWTKNFAKALAKRSNVVLLTYSQYLNWQNMRNATQPTVSQESGGKRLSIDAEIYLKDVPVFWERAWRLQESIFKEFQKVAKENNAKFMLMSLAEAPRTHDSLKKDFLAGVPDPSKLDLEMPDKQLSEIAKRTGIPYLATQKSFTARAADEDKLTVWPCDGHFNEVGHLWTAELLYGFIAGSGLLR